VADGFNRRQQWLNFGRLGFAFHPRYFALERLDTPAIHPFFDPVHAVLPLHAKRRLSIGILYYHKEIMQVFNQDGVTGLPLAHDWSQAIHAGQMHHAAVPICSPVVRQR
jgi:hypothetical protein